MSPSTTRRRSGSPPRPAVYLAGVAQRTKQLRFGPLVYTLPLYHPLRLTEEICMLDQMSGGRMQVGIGRGISPLETKGFGIDPAERVARYEDTRQVMMQGLTQKAVNFKGKFFSFDNVPMELEPFQKPHPPIWIGAATAESAARAARNGHNFVSLSTSAETRELTDSYRAAWKEAQGDKPLPKLGLGRFIVVADTDAAARALAAARLQEMARQLPSSLAQARHRADPGRAGARVRRDHGWRARRRRHTRDLHQDAAARSLPNPASTIRSGSSCSAT